MNNRLPVGGRASVVSAARGKSFARSSFPQAVAWIVAGLLLLACTSSPRGGGEGQADTQQVSGSGRSVPVAARALSRHYVDVRFDGPPGGSASDYLIVDPLGRRLEVHSLRVDEELRSALLVTAAQQRVSYTLQFEEIAEAAPAVGAEPALGSARQALTESLTFDGSDTAEPYLQTAVALGNTSVLLTFSEPLEPSLAEVPAAYRIVAASAEVPAQDLGDLQVIGAELKEGGASVTLTTSSQRDVRYHVQVANLRSRRNGIHLDPLRSGTEFFGLARDDHFPPEVVRADALAADSLLVSFSEPVNAWAADPATNYLITSSPVAVPARVDAGPDLVTQVNVPTPLLGRASAAAAVWTSAAGPGTVLFENASDPMTTATFSEPGVYVLRLQIDDGTLVVTDEITVEVDLGAAVVHHESVQGDAKSSDSVTSGSLSGVPGHLYIAAISTSSPVPVQALSGLGLDWRRVRSQCAGDHDPSLEVWTARGASGTSGSVTATLAKRTDRLVIAVSRYSGVDPREPLGSVAGANAAGPGGECPGGGADRFPNQSSWSVSVSPAAAPSRLYGAVAVGDREHEPRSSFEERVEHHQGTRGHPAGVVVIDGVAEGVGLQELGGRLDGHFSWAAAALELVPHRPPSVRAGADQVVPVGSAVALSGSVHGNNFDSLPADVGVAWSAVSASSAGSVTFESPTALATRASFSEAGTYVLRLTVSDAGLQVSDELVVVVADPTVVVRGAEAQAHQTQVLLATLPLSAGVPYTLLADNVTDQSANGVEVAHGAASFVFEGQPETDSGELSWVRGAISAGNTRVIVQFSQPMSDSALVPGHYSIVQVNVNPEVGALGVVDAVFQRADRKAVVLTTRSQNEVTYEVNVVNVTDLTGNPLAPPLVSQGVLVDPTRATFAGTPASGEQIVDTDGDGLSDSLEQSGWVVRVTLADGTTSTQEVTSNPGDPSLGPDHPVNVAARDTDQDGLSDQVERLLGSHPRQADTDGDSLSDDEEYNSVFSNQNSVDSDGDGIDDLLEVEFFKTNALTSDSDGDGYSDDDELFARGRDPRIADLPEHAIEIGRVTLRIDERFTFTDESGVTTTETSSTTSSLSTGTSRSTLELDGTTRFESGGAEFGLDTCQDGCDGLGTAQLVNRLFARFHGEGGKEVIDQTDTESAREAQEAFESSLEKAKELSSNSAVSRELVGASVLVEVALRNPGDVAISLSNLELTLQTTDPEDATRVVPVATLVPEGTLMTGGDSTVFNIGPGEVRGPVLFTNTNVFPNLVEALLQSPRGFITRVANYDLTTDDGRNFAFGLQSVRERTAGILIDFGDGQVQQYRAITAGVLDRPRDELRCAASGDHPNAACTSDADCGTSTPCQGGTIVGGFAGFGGTGRTSGVPLDFLLENVIQLRKTTPPIIVAGDDGTADTVAAGDDVQVLPVGTTGLSPQAVVVAPGRNLVLDSVPAGDDANPAAPDGILAGADAAVQSVARGDDVQLVPVGTRGVPEDTVVIDAGPDGVLDTTVRGDDRADVVTGYEVSRTCSPDTPFAIQAGPNGVVETVATSGTCAVAFAPQVRGQACRTDLDCGQDPSSSATGVCDDTDVQEHPFGSSGLAPDQVVISAGADGFVASVPAGDDLLLGPGTPCVVDVDCRASGLSGGTCTGPQKVVRVDSRRDGQFRRFWTLVLPEDVQFQTDFGLIRVRSGDVIGLKFLQDVDRDGLSSEVEFLAGSSDFKKDTDDDTLDDFAEVRIGWDVGVVGSSLRRVFSDPRTADSDADGLLDVEEFDTRPAHCACGAAGPVDLVGNTGTPCSSDADCGGASCLDAVACTLATFIEGGTCPPCSADPTLSRTDPRRRDSDADLVSDFEEVFGYLTGAGVMDATFAQVILAGTDRRADTLACPQNHCLEDPTQHCAYDGDCASRQCRRPVACDDVQVVPYGSGGWDPRTVVVAPGRLFSSLLGSAGLVSLETDAAAADVLESTDADGLGASRLVGDDVLFVAEGEPAHDGSLTQRQCVDGSRYSVISGSQGVAERFALCGLIRPGPDGILQSRPSADDVLVPAGFGQKREVTHPLNPDTDMDDIRDGFERALGASPNDPGDTGLAGDLDRDGLSDNQESSGWNVTTSPVVGAPLLRSVSSNPHIPDTDADGLPDYAERHMPCNDAPGTECPTDPTNPDSDGDGLSDLDELSLAKLEQLASFEGFFPAYTLDATGSLQLGTNPNDADTDGDSISDYDELFVDFAVRLNDGTLRLVRTSATSDDTDRDGATDFVERSRAAGATDPTDPDTDDDGKNDGLELGAGSDPLVADVLVTVNVERIEVESIEDPGGTANGEFGWWVLLDAPGVSPNPRLITDARDASAEFGTLFVIEDTTACYNRELEPGKHHTIHLDRSHIFSLREGESFSLYGLLAELDSGQSADCGLAPDYIPAHLNSQCYTRFSETFTFSDLSFGERGETIALNPVDATAQGGDSCAWQMVVELTVQ